MIPFITSRTSTWRLLPPRLAGGIKGSTCAHSSSVRSLGYRNLLRSSRPRFFAVHIGGAPLESGHHFESQTIQRIQNVFGRTLREASRGQNSPEFLTKNQNSLRKVIRIARADAHLRCTDHIFQCGSCCTPR